MKIFQKSWGKRITLIKTQKSLTNYMQKSKSNLCRATGMDWHWQMQPILAEDTIVSKKWDAECQMRNS